MLNAGGEGCLLEVCAEGVAEVEQAELIRDKVGELANDPFSQTGNVRRLQGRAEYRLRVQDWRIIFRVEGDILWIDDVGPRGSIY